MAVERMGQSNQQSASAEQRTTIQIKPWLRSVGSFKARAKAMALRNYELRRVHKYVISSCSRILPPVAVFMGKASTTGGLAASSRKRGGCQCEAFCRREMACKSVWLEGD